MRPPFVAHCQIHSSHVHRSWSAPDRRAQAKDAVTADTHVVITFTQAGQLRFLDPKAAGELFLTTPDELTEWTATIAGPVTHVWIEGKGHDLKGADQRVADAVAQWLNDRRG